MERTRGSIATGAALAFLLAACGGLGSSSGGGTGPGRISHPSGSGRLVLRIETIGGYVSPEALATRLPDFSLMGDGTVVTVGPVAEIYPGPALPSLIARTLTERGMQAVLRAAIEAGLLGPDRSYRIMTISDMPTTVFTLVAEGKKHVVSVYGLGESPSREIPTAERTARGALLGLERKLFGVTSVLPAGSYSKERRFDPKALSLFVRPYRDVADQNLFERAIGWPLAAPLATFGRPSGNLPGTHCGTVRGAEAASLLRLAREANQLTPWMSDGRAFALAFRPLLPAQSAC